MKNYKKLLDRYYNIMKGRKISAEAERMMVQMMLGSALERERYKYLRIRPDIKEAPFNLESIFNTLKYRCNTTGNQPTISLLSTIRQLLGLDYGPNTAFLLRDGQKTRTYRFNKDVYAERSHHPIARFVTHFDMYSIWENYLSITNPLKISAGLEPIEKGLFLDFDEDNNV